MRFNSGMVGAYGSKLDPRGPVEPKVKGVAFRTIDRCFRELCGERVHAEALGMMPPQVAEAYRQGTLLPASWYPISWYRDVFKAYRWATSMGPELPRRIGALAVQHDMQGVHKRFVAWVASPQTLLSLSQRVFKTYYDTGQLEVIAARSGFAHVRATGCAGWDLNMWNELVGSSGALLAAAGARHVRVYGMAGGQDGDDHHEIEAHWAP
jgi:hypothetical protein